MKLTRAKTHDINIEEAEPLTARQAVCLALLGLNFVGIIVGVLKFDFYMNEISALFIIMALPSPKSIKRSI